MQTFPAGYEKRNSGKILCFSSEVAIQPLPTFLHYCALKAAVLNLAKRYG
ncbi:MAG: hypothetical protein V8R80_00375 [Eubacterium sp.]